MALNPYIVVVRTLQPLMIRGRLSPRGYEALGNVIPASTLAGALARALRLEGGYGLVARGYAVSEAYPVVEVEGGGLAPAFPAPLLTVKVKPVEGRGPRFLVCLHVGGEGPLELLRKVYSFWEEKLGFKPLGLIKVVKPGAPVALASMKPLEGLEECYAGVGAEVEASYSYDSTAVNPARGSVEKEMLYTYYAIPRNTLFWATVSLPDDVHVESRVVELRLGGGRTRGYGRAVAAMERLPDTLLEELEKEYREIVEGGEEYRFFLWSPLPARLGQQTMFRCGWSSIAGMPRLAMPMVKPGSLLELENRQLASQSLLEARFRGLVPPLGHAEPVSGKRRLPPSLQKLTPIVERLASLAGGEAS